MENLSKNAVEKKLLRITVHGTTKVIVVKWEAVFTKFALTLMIELKTFLRQHIKAIGQQIVLEKTIVCV